MDPPNDEVLRNLGKGELPGLTGISASGNPVFHWLGVARDALLEMPAKQVMDDNKITRIMYDNPHYLLQDNLAALKRIFNQRDAARAANRLMGYFNTHATKHAKSKAMGHLAYQMNYYGAWDKMSDSWVNKKRTTVKSFVKWIRFAWDKFVDWKHGGRAAWNLPKDAKQWMKDVKDKEIEDILLMALSEVGKVYGDEAEWNITSDKFKIPRGSKLVILRSHIPDQARKDVEKEKKLGGTLKGPATYNWEDTIEKDDRLLATVKKYKLDSRYKVVYVDRKKFDATRAKYFELRAKK
jgi:hypothetical protein